jgi:DNA-binding MarR family transcriptional regulator
MGDRLDPARARAISRTFGELCQCLHLLNRPFWVDIDLSMAQFKTAMLIASTGGLPVGELAKHLGVGPSAVTPLVDKLVDHGYVRREEDPSDRRVIWVRPTDTCHAFYERVNAAGRDQLERVLLTLTPGDVDLAERALAILHAAAERLLEEERASSRPVKGANPS